MARKEIAEAKIPNAKAIETEREITSTAAVETEAEIPIRKDNFTCATTYLIGPLLPQTFLD